MKLAARNMTQMGRIRRLTSPDQLLPGQYNNGNTATGVSSDMISIFFNLFFNYQFELYVMVDS